MRGASLFRFLAGLAGATALAGCSMEGVQSVFAPASPDARAIATLSAWMFAIATFIMIVTIGLLIVGLALGQRRQRNRISFRTSTAIVIAGGVIAPVLAIAAVTASGVAISSETEGRPGSGALIEVIGRRWWWELRYFDEDGELVAVTANELHLPVGERSRLKLVSDNVIHSFWAPNIQGKTDLIPGKVNHLYAEPAEAGVWRGQCAEFCGVQHALMGMVVVAEPREAYDAWLAGQARDAAVTEHPGLEVFVEYECDECHTIRGAGADGDFGPDLTHLASRRTLAAATIPNTRGNLGGWITSTQEVKPGALMPSIRPEPDELLALLDYLETLE